MAKRAIDLSDEKDCELVLFCQISSFIDGKDVTGHISSWFSCQISSFTNGNDVTGLISWNISWFSCQISSFINGNVVTGQISGMV